MSIPVFYAWQSDRHQRTNRHFIKKAIESALKKLNRDLKIQDAPSFEIDHDTKDGPPHQEIAETISRKIRKCGIFIADVTLVASYASTGDREKWTPNANVMIELGMAMRKPGWGRILLIQNAAYGTADGLPFDLRHRSFPVQYTLKEDASDEEIKKAKDDLATEIARQLKTVVDKVIVAQSELTRQQREAEEAAQRQATAEKWKAFDQRLQKNQFFQMTKIRHPAEGEGTTFFDRDAYVSLAVIPLRPPAKMLDIQAINAGHPADLRPIGNDSWSKDPYGRSLFCYEGGRNSDGSPQNPTSVLELMDDGSIFAAAQMTLHDRTLQRRRIYRLQGEERQLLSGLARYVKALRSYGVVGPLEVRVQLIGVAETYLLPMDTDKWMRSSLRINAKDTITLEPAIIGADVDGSNPDVVAAAMKPAFTVVWQDVGMPYDPTFERAKT